MKKFRFLLLFLSALAITACSSDDDNSSSGGITGKWKAVSWHIQGDFEEGTFTADGVDFGNMSITFKDDGTFVSDGDEFTVQYNFNLNGMEFSQEFTNESPFSTGTWEKNGDVLKLKNDGEPEVYDYHIDKLTSSKLELSIDDFQLDEEGVEGAFKVNMGFKR